MLFFRRRHHLSPLILLIFITFFNTVLSRHRIRHHRDRFKRQQGAHLFLPGSYVYDGGEEPEAGPWSEWSTPSPCSRSCGGGVSTQVRQCTPGYTCQGPTSRHFSCNTQDCPDIGDFREQQCAEFNSVPFEGITYDWIPYTKAPNTCELNCMPRGERFYYRHRAQVIDGTRCNDESLDVCVQGKCHPVGCDMMLGSSAREDRCRRCGGDSSTCNTVTGLLDMQDLQAGYNDILLIPAGATNILVEEREPSNNYLAIRNTSGYYYLNGNWRIDFPRTMDFAGCKFHYERYPQGFSAPDKITCLGPIDEALFVVLLYQDRNVGVNYEYSLPTNIQPGSESETYAWTFDQFTSCSATCGGGVQYRNVTCAGRRTLEPVDRSLCDANNEPASSQKCAEVPCEAQWVPYPWGNCSAPCGEGGIQTREIACQQIVSNGYPSLVDAELCASQTKPPQQQQCNVGKVCAKWHIGPWKPCDHLCGDGKKVRQVRCYRKEEDNIEILDESECLQIEPKPESEEKCNLRPCEGVDWITSEWSGCNKCGLTNETRKVQCATSDGTVYSDDLCEKEQKPELVRECKVVNASCDYTWYASQWSECSAECGQGVQTRILFCGVVTPEGSVKKVEDDKCGSSQRYETIRNCTGEVEKCPGEWFSGPWAECSKPCGGGERSRKVVCLKDLKVVDPSKCGEEKIIFGKEECNTQPCSEDAILPTDVTKPIDESEKSSEGTEPSVTEETQETVTAETEEFITEAPKDEDYEIVPADECEDGEWMEEEPEKERKSEALKEKLGTSTETSVTGGSSETGFSLDDLMLSDAPASPEGSEDTLLTGSGDGEVTSPISVSGTSDLTDTTFEGSGGTEPTIITDIFETDTAITLESSPHVGSESTDTSTDVSGISTDIGITSTEVSGATETNDITTVGTETSEVTTELSSSEITDRSGFTTELSGGTESSLGITTESSELTSTSSDATETTESGTTESVTTEVSQSSESTEVTPTTEYSESTETTESIESSPTTESIESSSTTETTESTPTTENTESTETSESTITTESTETTETSSLESSSSTPLEISTVSDTVSETTTSEVTNESDEPNIVESDVGARTQSTTKTSELPTEFTSTTESVTEITSSTETTSEITGSAETTTELSETTVSTSELTGSTEVTTELSGSTVTTSELAGSTEVTTELTMSTIAASEFTGSTEMTESTVGLTGSTEVPEGTELPGSTQETTEYTGSTESPATTGSTTEYTGSTETTEFDIWSTTTESGVTEASTSPDLWETTPIVAIFKAKKPRMCKRKKQKDCKSTKFGCCWDKITPAKGPFDKGCPIPKTCKESVFGCCEDGVSPALGKNFKGCPSTHCNETLFGCCSDNKTIAEGNNNEGCPPPPPACLKSKYGCCKDNVTEAEGPKQEGCEEEKEEEPKEITTTPIPTEDCSNTTHGCCPDGVKAAQGEFFKGCDIFKENCTESYFRCCPDGVTSAQGPSYRGCKMPCSDSQYGCCPDGITPAHGYTGEGCCLAGPFGCCPDNILPARGPNLEGCGCQYSPYGCCPDNSTAARGYNNEGCGCQHTEHGCCPDDYTPADGPEYKGCLCHTFQFGCCPDGITVAKGPHQQGCGCRNTEFGCCSDDRTPAQGPDFAGCGCDASRYGCCPDGVSEAKGDDFEGCEYIPEDFQESCAQPRERGTCRNYTVKWFFDMDYGGCSRFWYGGCEGTKNRFKSKEECDGICVKPQGVDRCKLPKVPGPCEGYYPQWYYDKERKSCTQFIYGGCLGNNNRFETREECMSLCVVDDNIDACEQKKYEGPCNGTYRRWYFDKESQSCQQFVYGGCKSNSNNFPTEEACKQQCAQPGRKKDHCSLPRAQGNCTSREARWYYDIPEKRCLPFYYSGCYGNNNNFVSREACEADCPKEIEKDLCHLPADVGTCGNYTERWYFDTKEKHCRQFYYGGCAGNENNFETQEQCDRRCKEQEPEPTQPSETRQEPFTTDMCFLPSETGPCRSADVRYHYDRRDGVCKGFTYGGCNGNRNNFASIDECLQYCGNAQDLCTLPPVVGPCNSEYEQHYYDPSTDSCKSFNYGGCGGNYNRFSDKVSCEQRCRKSPPEQPIQTQAPPVSTPSSDVAMCYEQPDPGNCTDNLSVFFYDYNTGICTPFTYTGCGGNGNRFTSEEQCERQCGNFRGQDVCNMTRDPGPCRGYFVKYYYDKARGQCGQFAYGGCRGNGNRFSSNEECESICVTHSETKTNVTSTAVCELPADTGSCQDGYHKRWYFDNARGECIAFIFSGCGGNLNNFKTFQSCVEFCRDYLPVTQPPPSVEDHPCQAHFDECATLRCPYGIEAYVDENQCNRCQCQNPCKKVDCPEGSQCAIDINRNKTTSLDPDFIAVCREINKEGECPTLQSTDTNCEQECRNDADCALQLKCCSVGCSTSCVEPAIHVPAELVTQTPLPAYTESPVESIYYAPKVDVETYEPEVQGLLGDQVTLRCAVTGNPTPKITWRKDDLLIDGTHAKYRIKLDQALQIITLHKTDSGVYLCTADNSIGEPVTNEIKLDVVDGGTRPATVIEPDDQPNDVVVSLNAPATLNCLALGYPFPAVTWWKDDSLIPLKTSQFEVRKDYSLLIHSVKLSNLGIYTCQAYNGIGKAASWSVTVKAKGPYHSTNPKDEIFLKYIVNPPELPPTTVAPPQEWPQYPYRPQHPAPPPERPSPQPQEPPPEYNIRPNETEVEPSVVAPILFIVPVQTNITLDNQRFPTNSDISIPCIVDGFPLPEVHWYKDGIEISPSSKHLISESHRLTIIQATKSDSGMYQCEAANAYSKSSSSISILVDGMYIHPNCKDNRFFANCDLIVKARFCSHKYYAKFCCRSCTEAGLLPVDGAHLQTFEKQSALSSNLV